MSGLEVVQDALQSNGGGGGNFGGIDLSREALLSFFGDGGTLLLWDLIVHNSPSMRETDWRWQHVLW